MARLRYNGLRAVLDGALTDSATTVDFTAPLTHSNGVPVPTISGGDVIALTILDADGHLAEVVWLTAYTEGDTDGTILRGQEGTDGVAHDDTRAVVHAPTALDLAGGGGGGGAGGVIAYTFWDPDTLEAYSTISTVDSAVDADNLTVTFTAPDSGVVIVVLEGIGGIDTSGATMMWSIREGATVLFNQGVTDYTGAATNSRIVATFVIEDLTPGDSYTYDWGWRTSGTGTARIYAGLAGTVQRNPAVMLVLAGPAA